MQKKNNNKKRKKMHILNISLLVGLLLAASWSIAQKVTPGRTWTAVRRPAPWSTRSEYARPFSARPFSADVFERRRACDSDKKKKPFQRQRPRVRMRFGACAHVDKTKWRRKKRERERERVAHEREGIFTFSPKARVENFTVVKLSFQPIGSEKVSSGKGMRTSSGQIFLRWTDYFFT